MQIMGVTSIIMIILSIISTAGLLLTKFENKSFLNFNKIVSIINFTLLLVAVSVLGVYWFLAFVLFPSDESFSKIIIITLVIIIIFIVSYILRFKKIHTDKNISLNEKIITLLLSTVIEIMLFILLIKPEIYFNIIEMLY